MMRLQREKEAEQFEAWATQEDQFHLEQARLRSRIRIADARGLLLFKLLTFRVTNSYDSSKPITNF